MSLDNPGFQLCSSRYQNLTSLKYYLLFFFPQKYYLTSLNPYYIIYKIRIML